MEMANKEKILLSFQSINGTIRLLIATIVFGMGVDCKGVHSHSLWTCQKCGILYSGNWKSRQGWYSKLCVHFVPWNPSSPCWWLYETICKNKSLKFCICAVITVLQIMNVVCLIVEL